MQVRRVLGEKTYKALKPEIQKLIGARDVLRDFEDVSSGNCRDSAAAAIYGIDAVLIALGAEDAPVVANPHPGRKEDPFVAPCGKA